MTKITKDRLKAYIQGNKKPMVIKFWAPWCKPCLVMAPLLEKVAKELAPQVAFASVNLDENPQTAAQYQVRSIPTLLLVDGAGKVIKQLVGQAIEISSLKKTLSCLS